MAAIDVEERPALNLMIFTMRGDLSPDLMHRAQSRFYADGKAKHAILDLRACSLDLFTLDDFKRALSLSKTRGDHRRGGVTVFIAEHPHLLALDRLYQAYAEATPNFPVTIAIAASLDKAIAQVESANGDG
ncbi:MAG: hypothetical protein RIB45_15105 [Marivibrio sp.]|uniref:hypothetical protein n=1 Tax=Marivibrio sp. TaxID=2039719 RepID=UPI0032EDDE61